MDVWAKDDADAAAALEAMHEQDVAIARHREKQPTQAELIARSQGMSDGYNPYRPKKEEKPKNKEWWES